MWTSHPLAPGPALSLSGLPVRRAQRLRRGAPHHPHCQAPRCLAAVSPLLGTFASHPCTERGMPAAGNMPVCPPSPRVTHSGSCHPQHRFAMRLRFAQPGNPVPTLGTIVTCVWHPPLCALDSALCLASALPAACQIDLARTAVVVLLRCSCLTSAAPSSRSGSHRASQRHRPVWVTRPGRRRAGRLVQLRKERARTGEQEPKHLGSGVGEF